MNCLWFYATKRPLGTIRKSSGLSPSSGFVFVVEMQGGGGIGPSTHTPLGPKKTEHVSVSQLTHGAIFFILWGICISQNNNYA